MRLSYQMRAKVIENEKVNRKLHGLEKGTFVKKQNIQPSCVVTEP